jgi:hypothetical protein
MFRRGCGDIVLNYNNFKNRIPQKWPKMPVRGQLLAFSEKNIPPSAGQCVPELGAENRRKFSHETRSEVI